MNWQTSQETLINYKAQQGISNAQAREEINHTVLPIVGLLLATYCLQSIVCK